ncbi:MAG: TolB family protein [bacterium]
MTSKIIKVSGLLGLIVLTASCCCIFSGNIAKKEKPQVVAASVKDTYTVQAIQQWYKQYKPTLDKALAVNRIFYLQAGVDSGIYSKTFGKNDIMRLPDFKRNISSPVVSKNHKILYLETYCDAENSYILYSLSREHGAKYVYTFTKPPYYFDVSPDGRELAFSTKEGDINQIYRVNLKTKELTLITDSLIGGVFPNYSPNGRWIAYFAQRKLRVKDINTGEERILVDDPMLKELPKWSPDGTWIVYQAKTADAALYDIYKVNVYTGKIMQLTTQPGLDANPSFDRTGRKIIFMSASDGPQGNQRLAMMDANGDNLLVDQTSYTNIYYPQIK